MSLSSKRRVKHKPLLDRMRAHCGGRNGDKPRPLLRTGLVIVHRKYRVLGPQIRQHDASGVAEALANHLDDSAQIAYPAPTIARDRNRLRMFRGYNLERSHGGSEESRLKRLARSYLVAKAEANCR